MFDNFVLLVVVVSGVFGLMNGLRRELLFHWWVLPSCVALYAFPTAQLAMSQHIANAYAAGAVVAIAIFVGSVIVASPAYAVVAALSDFRLLDLALGILFGLIRGILIVAVLLILVGWLWWGRLPEWFEASRAVQMFDMLSKS